MITLHFNEEPTHFILKYETPSYDLRTFKFSPLLNEQWHITQFIYNHSRITNTFFLLSSIIYIGVTIFGTNESSSYIVMSVCLLIIIIYMTAMMDRTITLNVLYCFDYWFLVVQFATFVGVLQYTISIIYAKTEMFIISSTISQFLGLILLSILGLIDSFAGLSKRMKKIVFFLFIVYELNVRIVKLDLIKIIEVNIQFQCAFLVTQIVPLALSFLRA